MIATSYRRVSLAQQTPNAGQSVGVEATGGNVHLVLALRGKEPGCDAQRCNDDKADEDGVSTHGVSKA